MERTTSDPMAKKHDPGELAFRREAETLVYA